MIAVALTSRAVSYSTEISRKPSWRLALCAWESLVPALSPAMPCCNVSNRRRVSCRNRTSSHSSWCRMLAIEAAVTSADSWSDSRCNLRSTSSTKFALEPNRNLVELVLRRLHRLSDQESADVPAASIASILHQLEWLDVRFLQETRRRLETLQQGIAGLKAGTKDSHAQSANLQDGLREISVLYETARDVRATAIIQFLHGLETLFLEVVYKGVALDPQRVEAVAARVDSLVAMAQQWVQMGRTEKAAIEKALAPLLDNAPAHK